MNVLFRDSGRAVAHQFGECMSIHPVITSTVHADAMSRSDGSGKTPVWEFVRSVPSEKSQITDSYRITLTRKLAEKARAVVVRADPRPHRKVELSTPDPGTMLFPASKFCWNVSLEQGTGDLVVRYSEAYGN